MNKTRDFCPFGVAGRYELQKDVHGWTATTIVRYDLCDRCSVETPVIRIGRWRKLIGCGHAVVAATDRAGQRSVIFTEIGSEPVAIIRIRVFREAG